MLEFNGRNQLTLWGPKGEINDYAKKEWGGLVRSYYKKRYKLLVEMALDCLHFHNIWNQSNYTNINFNSVELPWQTDTTTFPTKPEFDAVELVTTLFAKYVQS